MKYFVKIMTCSLALLAFVSPAFAGTATIDFSYGVGPLNYKVSGLGELTAVGGRASFSGSNVTLMAEGGSPLSCGQTTLVTMSLVPYSDAGSGVGLIMTDSSGWDQVTAICSTDGTVTLMDWIGNYRNLQFSYPAALNWMTLEYNAYIGRAVLTLNGTSSVFLEMALNGAMSVRFGVAANGPGGFEDFTATGSCVSDYPVPDLDTDGDGVIDTEEIAAGTDPDDPGSLPVERTEGATINALNGVTVTIPPNTLPAGATNIKVSTPDSTPEGNIPDGKVYAGVAVELEPSGLNFTGPVTVTVPYSSGDIVGLEEDTLTAFYFADPDYSASGIAGVSVDTGQRKVTFTTTHFTVFILAADLVDSDGDGVPDQDDAFPFNPFGATDSDGDGIGDEWEEMWFGNGNGIVEPGELDVADEFSDFDGDEVLDINEFNFWQLGLSPLDGVSQLPAAGALAGILLGAALLVAGVRRMRR